MQSQSAAVPVEIQIDSDDGDNANDDEDDVGIIAEPLVVLSSSVNLEDQDVSERKMHLQCNNEHIFLLVQKRQLVLWLIVYNKL